MNFTLNDAFHSCFRQQIPTEGSGDHQLKLLRSLPPHLAARLRARRGAAEAVAIVRSCRHHHAYVLSDIEDEHGEAGGARDVGGLARGFDKSFFVAKQKYLKKFNIV